MAKATRARRPKKSAADADLTSPSDVFNALAADLSDPAKRNARPATADIQPARGPVLIRKSLKAEAATTRSERPGSSRPHREGVGVAKIALTPPAKLSTVAWLARVQARQLTPAVATIAIAASCGAIAGSLATVAVAKFSPFEVIAATATNADLAQQVARIDAELITLKTSVGALAKADDAVTPKSDRLDQRLATGSSEATGSTTSAASGAPVPPKAVQPTVLEGWVLRNVSGGSALVEGRPGLIQVMPGDSLPGVGRVETIKREDGRWVVVTPRGLIVAR